MQRSELKKELKKKSKALNFYKMGLLKKLILKREKEYLQLLEAVPKVSCPECGSRDLTIDYDDRDWVDASWLFCEDCGNDFRHDEYIRAISNLEDLQWSMIPELYCSLIEDWTNSYEWQKKCEKYILEELERK